MQNGKIELNISKREYNMEEKLNTNDTQVETETVSEPDVEQTTEPVAEQTTEPVSEQAAEPVQEPVEQPTAQAQQGPEIKPKADNTITERVTIKPGLGLGIISLGVAILSFLFMLADRAYPSFIEMYKAYLREKNAQPGYIVKVETPMADALSQLFLPIGRILAISVIVMGFIGIITYIAKKPQSPMVNKSFIGVFLSVLGFLVGIALAVLAFNVQYIPVITF